MPQPLLILITGLPGTGKTTLGRRLALHLRLPLIAKDLVKEPLLELLGAADRARSRQLSDASFAVQFAVAGELLGAAVGVILEGNFRPGEHEEGLHRVLSAVPPVRIVQIRCRTPETLRVARLYRRSGDPTRHAGHRDGELAQEGASPDDGFLNLAGVRLEFDGSVSSGGHEASMDELLDEISRTSDAVR